VVRDGAAEYHDIRIHLMIKQAREFIFYRIAVIEVNAKLNQVNETAQDNGKNNKAGKIPFHSGS
jgi:hypothetical protein